MYTVVAALLALIVGLAAYARGKREGTWSWRRFVFVVGTLTGIGGLLGGAAGWLGRRWGPEAAGPLAIAAAAAIIGSVLLFAMALRRRNR